MDCSGAFAFDPVHIGVDLVPESNFKYTFFHRSEINSSMYKFLVDVSIERNCKNSQQTGLKVKNDIFKSF